MSSAQKLVGLALLDTDAPEANCAPLGVRYLIAEFERYTPLPVIISIEECFHATFALGRPALGSCALSLNPIETANEVYVSALRETSVIERAQLCAPGPSVALDEPKVVEVNVFVAEVKPPLRVYATRTMMWLAPNVDASVFTLRKQSLNVGAPSACTNVVSSAIMSDGVLLRSSGTLV